METTGHHNPLFSNILFMVKKEVSESVSSGQKNIELRKGKAREGDIAVFQCGGRSSEERLSKKNKES